MSTEENGEQETLNPDEEEEKEEEQEEEEKEDIEEVKQRLAKAEELAGNYKIRAEKAEAKAKEKPIEKSAEHKELTSKDVLTLASNGITNDEDVELVEKWANFNGKPIREILKDDTLQSILSKRQEERKTASATQTKGGAGGSSKLSGEALLEKANRGQYPTEEADIERMIAAKFEAKRKK